MDKSGKKALLTHLEALAAGGRTMLMVDHDDVLAQIANRVVSITNKQNLKSNEEEKNEKEN
jgi:ABC-type lipoprotein export system ATPase subunit